MRIRPTFASIEQGLPPPLVKQERFPSLEFLRSPEYNVFYQTAVGLRQQSMRIQGHEAEARQFDAAATAAGTSSQQPKAEARQKRRNESDQAMAEGHFKTLRMQQEQAEQARLAKQITDLDAQMALHNASIAPPDVATRLAQAQNIPLGSGQTGADSSSSTGPLTYSIVSAPKPKGWTRKPRSGAAAAAMDAGFASEVEMEDVQQISKYTKPLAPKRTKFYWSGLGTREGDDPAINSHFSPEENAIRRDTEYNKARRKYTLVRATNSGAY